MSGLFNIVGTSKLGSEEIVLTIVGGTMLSLALTRPRLRWMERLTETSPGSRLWTERGLTVLAFGIGGYAWVTLFITLRGQLEAGPARLIHVAAYVLIAYAGLTHFEPFVNGRMRSGSVIAAFFAYFGWAVFAAGVGAASALDVRVSSISAGWAILRLVSVTAAGCFVLWWLFPKFEAAVNRLFKSADGPPEPGGSTTTPDSKDTEDQTSASVKIVALSFTVPILMRIVHEAWRNRATGESH